MSGYVFVSHSTADNQYVAELADFLRTRDIPVWVDDTLAAGDSHWVKRLELAIRGAAAVVLVMSPHADDSPWVDREIDLAQELRKPIVPLRLSGQTMLRVRDTQFEDVSGHRMPGPQTISRLSDALRPRTRVAAVTPVVAGDG
jgi:hypothetical protein